MIAALPAFSLVELRVDSSLLHICLCMFWDVDVFNVFEGVFLVVFLGLSGVMIRTRRGQYRM